MTVKPPKCSDPDRAWPAAQWVPLLKDTGLLVDHAKSSHSFDIRAGKWLAAQVKLGRAVPVAHGGRTGKAVLRASDLRSGKTGYYFAVTWDTPAAEGDAPVPDAPDVPPAPPPAVPSPRPPAAGGNAEDWQ